MSFHFRSGPDLEQIISITSRLQVKYVLVQATHTEGDISEIAFRCIIDNYLLSYHINWAMHQLLVT